MKKRFLFIFSICLVLLCSQPVPAFSEKTPQGAERPALVIVIDPGHGGKDAGAVSKSGIKEKDITLGVALELQRLLREKTNLKAVLTRTEDKNISLDKRARLASKADIFISIHVNSSEYRKVKGVETFFLSFEASSNEARMVAARENNVPEIKIALDAGETLWEDEDYFNEEDVGDILLDMVQTESHHASARLAEAVHRNLIKTTGARNRGVRQAPFRVLAGTAVPAVLLELGFLSNKTEARRLALPKTQRELATAIAAAIVKFDSDLAPLGAKNGHARLKK